MSKEERRRQLMAQAWAFVAEEGTDALTLARLAERAGVTKPVAYEHFGTRAGLLAELYRDYDRRQAAALRAALEAGAATLDEAARILARAYVDCIVSAQPEIIAVSGALAGSPELEAVKRECLDAFMAECREALAPFAGGAAMTTAGMIAMIGAAESLSAAAASGQVTSAEATAVLTDVILALPRSEDHPGRGRPGDDMPGAAA